MSTPDPSSQALRAAFLRQLSHRSDAEDLAQGFAQEIDATLHDVAGMRERGEISDVRARILVDAQADATKAALMARAGMDLDSAQIAVNAALRAVEGLVVKAAGKFF